jgi:predicted metalloprotease with PDZ domain
MTKKSAFSNEHLSPNPYRLLWLCILALNAFSSSIASAIPDSGKPGLKGPSEAELRTKRDVIDRDSDGLSDFQEVHKYLTDPAKTDTDGDGVPDGDWSERREYTYSVCTVLRFIPPFDRAALNDDYQDARVLKKTDDYIELEVVHYPLATAYESIDENPNWQRDYAGMSAYLKPGVTTNWDAQMKHDLLAELEADGILIDKLTDRQAVEQVSSWLLKKSRSLNKVFTTNYVDLPNAQPSVFPGLEDAFKREFDRDKENYDWTMDQHFDHELLGKGMFYNKTHGSCTSFAVYLTTVLRAIGIPTRMVIAIPVVDASNKEQIGLVKERIAHNTVREITLAGLRRSAQGFTAHTFNEVYVGNRWRRLNYSKLGQSILDLHLFGLHTHLYTFCDLSDADLARTWGRRYAKGQRDVVFKYSNPYSVMTISDLFGCHSSVSNPPFTSHELPTSPSSKLPNIYIMSPRSSDAGLGVFEEIVEIVKNGTFNKTGRLHEKKSYDEIFIDNIWGRKPNDIVVLVFSLDIKDRIPQAYEDLLPRPWAQIEKDLRQGKTVSLSGGARDMKIILLATPRREQLRQLIHETELLRLNKTGQAEGHKPLVPKTRPSFDLPNIFIMSPSGFYIFGEIIEMVRGVTRSKTGRYHEVKSYDEILIEGIHDRKPGDIMVLLFSLDTKDRIPAKYEDLLPVAWSAIESALKQGRTLELNSTARSMNIIVLAAPTTGQLRQLARESMLLRALGGQHQNLGESLPNQRWTRTGRTKGPVAYTVTISRQDWRKAFVSCRMSMNDVLSLWMNNNGAPRVPDGHASFVRNLTATDPAGNTIPVKNYGEARWTITPTENRPITLSYDVILEHDKSDLPWGRDEAPYVTNDGAFWTGRALFIVGEMNDITVHFDLPDGWRVSTPWQSVPNQATTFSMNNANELTEAFIFAGTHIEQRAKAGDMEIILALGNQLRPSSELLQQTSQKLLNAYAALFGGTVPGRILIVTNPQDIKHSFDGGVFGRSISMLMGDEPSKDNVERWAPFIAHEVFHLWNGKAINYAGQEYWFSEGFTEYYANVTAARIGLIGERDFLQRLGRACESYYQNVGQVSIRKAGDSESRNSALQYQGGSLVAATLDIRIRKAKDNTKSLDDLMRQMYDEFGTTGKKYTIEDVERIACEITGKDYTQFFEKYVRGTDEMPLEEDFGWMGLDVEKQIMEELPDRGYVIHKMLRIQSLGRTSKGMIIRRSQDAGYQDDDILLAVAGTPVETFKDLQRMATKWKPGDEIELTLVRNQEQIKMEMALGGEGQQVPLEREVKVTIVKRPQLNSAQKAILSGMIGQQSL